MKPLSPDAIPRGLSGYMMVIEEPMDEAEKWLITIEAHCSVLDDIPANKELTDAIRSNVVEVRQALAAKDTEIAGLRLLIRGEQTKPPFDVADDQTTEMAVEIAALTAEVERLRQEAQAYAESIDNVREVLGLETTHYLIIHDEVRDCIAALTADLAARGETIVRLEGIIEGMEAQLCAAKDALQWCINEGGWRLFYYSSPPTPGVFDQSDFVNVKLNEPLPECEHKKQVIEERWQKDRAEWFLEHALCSKDACGNGPNISHEKWDWTPDQWRRQAEEQLKETA